MYICTCRAVSEGEVEAVLEAGDASLEDVQRSCGAGGDCGACCGRLQELIQSRAAGAREDGAAAEAAAAD